MGGHQGAASAARRRGPVEARGSPKNRAGRGGGGLDAFHSLEGQPQKVVGDGSDGGVRRPPLDEGLVPSGQLVDRAERAGDLDRVGLAPHAELGCRERRQWSVTFRWPQRRRRSTAPRRGVTRRGLRRPVRRTRLPAAEGNGSRRSRSGISNETKCQRPSHGSRPAQWAVGDSQPPPHVITRVSFFNMFYPRFRIYCQHRHRRT